MHVLFWGTYDAGKPRVRIMREAMTAAGLYVTEIHTEVWTGVEDKSQLRGAFAKASRALRWALAYPALLWRYCRARDHDVVLIGYMGVLDVLVLWPFAMMRGKPIVWDAFLSLYDTVARDRKLFSPRHPAALALKALEWLACRAATRVVLDTAAHAKLFQDLYALPEEKTNVVFVGAEPLFVPAPSYREEMRDETVVLFYGQFIPLHGIETIVAAAQRTVHSPIRWVLIGRGQEAERIRRIIDEGPAAQIEWTEWVPYADLPQRIREADICLGVFGDTEKAASVIPNKVFQIIASGKPLITRDGPAIREWLAPENAGLRLIPPSNADALVRAVEDLRKNSHEWRSETLHTEARRAISPAALGAAWRGVLDAAVKPAARARAAHKRPESIAP